MGKHMGNIVRVGFAAVALMALAAQGMGAPLATETVSANGAANEYLADGVVEAVRTSSIGADISGRVTALLVHAGDKVKAGQVLLRIDERVANQQALATQSQVAAAQAQLDAAKADFERRQSLYQQKFLSKAALDRAEAEYKSAAAQAKAQIAQATAAGVQTGLHTIAAPYDGIVAETLVELGDMVTPGRPLINFYDPAALRATVNVPQSQVAALRHEDARVEIAGVAAPVRVQADAVTVLPTADPMSHMVQARLALPAQTVAAPGAFARAWLPTAANESKGRLTIAQRAVIRRSELTAVYVIDKEGKPQLRQVRLGRSLGDRIEVLAGLTAGERVALDPLAAANVR